MVTSPLVVNTMVVGLLSESLIYGAFFLATFATAIFFFTRTHKYPSQYGARIVYPVTLFVMFIVATVHEFVTIFCTMDHVIADQPGVLLLAASKGLHVTQVMLALIVLIYRVFTHFTRLKIFALPLTILVFIAAAAGYRAVYELYDSNFGLNLILNPNVQPNLPFSRPLLGTYETWITGFNAGALVLSTVTNVFLCVAILQSRFSYGLSASRVLLSVCLESGIPITLIVGATLPVQLFLPIGITFVLENAAVPLIALIAIGPMFIYAINRSFDADVDAEDKVPLTKPNMAMSGSRPSSPSPMPLSPRSRGDLESGFVAKSLGSPASPFDDKSDSGAWRAQLQGALDTVPPVAMVQARQMRAASKATSGQLSSSRSGRRSPTKPIGPRTSSRLRNVISAEDMRDEAAPHVPSQVSSKDSESYLPAMD